MKRLLAISTIIFISIFYSFSINHNNPSIIIGKWKGEEKEMKMEIYLAKDTHYYGKIISEQGSGKNAGKIIIKELEFDQTTNTYKGILCPPDQNVELDITISVISNDILKVVGKKLMMTKTFYLLRIK